jgi:hypothetical protein
MVMKSAVRGVRWNEETQEFEMRCDACAGTQRGPSYWPLTLEFWTPEHGLAKCRACHLHAKAARAKERLDADPARRAAKAAAMREQRKLKWPVWEAARRERLSADPERMERVRARRREATRRYRARLAAERSAA